MGGWPHSSSWSVCGGDYFYPWRLQADRTPPGTDTWLSEYHSTAVMPPISPSKSQEANERTARLHLRPAHRGTDPGLQTGPKGTKGGPSLGRVLWHCPQSRHPSWLCPGRHLPPSPVALLLTPQPPSTACSSGGGKAAFTRLSR